MTEALRALPLREAAKEVAQLVGGRESHPVVRISIASFSNSGRVTTIRSTPNARLMAMFIRKTPDPRLLPGAHHGDRPFVPAQILGLVDNHRVPAAIFP